MSNKAKTMSVKEILSNEVLDYFIEPENCRFFLKKQSDFAEVANVVNSSKVDAMFEISNLNQARENFLNLHGLHIPQEIGSLGKSDNIVTSKMAEKMKAEYIGFSDKISADKLLLFLAAITADFLRSADKVKNGTASNLDSTELCYGNGDIITISENAILLSKDGRRDVMTVEELQEYEDKMVEAVLIANKQINASNKNLKLAISDMYKPTGDKRQKRISYSAKDLQEYAQSPELLGRLSAQKMGDLLDKDLISKYTLIKMFSRGALDKNIAITLFVDGKFKREDALKIFKVQRENDIPLNQDVSYESKLLLYSAGKIKIDLLEKAVKQYQEENINLTDTFRKISKYYSNDIRKISELLTHNVLDYNNSQRFLEVLEQDGCILPEDKKYLMQVMADFKTNELLNTTENEVVSLSSGEGTGYQKYKPGLTIDSEERKKYFQSLGAVKKVKIRGESFIRDSESNVVKKNSLDGYELYVIPEKRMAILEKLYETTRDKNGKIEYKKNKEGKLIPAVENATYIIPIEMAADFARKKNKKELIESSDVRRVSHSMEWVSNLESKAKSLMKIRGVEVEFDEKNTELWAERIRQNYIENKRKRDTR